ncbi:hypothetical protein [Marilutibacter maris]|uniref:hypothetical protein n=1 Tax=Marilutibacter maris TaxID=1605891 RepID=UPI000DA9827A|nr:hypothetical protein [Lysobacter maris]
MLEFIGTIAICAACLWLVRYLWRFWRYRQSISTVEALALAVKAKADFVAINAGSDAAESPYFIAACLKGLADSLSYGSIASPLVAKAQLNVLEQMIGSPDDVAFIMDRSIESITDIRLGLIHARESFILLHQAIETR